MASADRQMIGDATLAPQGFRPGVVVSSVAQRLWLAYPAGLGFTPSRSPPPPPPTPPPPSPHPPPPPHPAPGPARRSTGPPPPAAQPVTLQRLRLADPLRWLLKGLQDMRAAPGIASFYG